MLWVRRPQAEELAAFLERVGRSGYSYIEVGASRASPPTDYAIDHHRIRLGNGQQTFLVACEALRCWRMFNLGWVSVQPPLRPIVAGQVVAVLAQVFGLWFLNACTIVYVRQEQGPIERFGFAYGTLHEHLARGEERFTVEWNHADDSVWYDLFAFSLPNHWLFRLGYPLARRVQHRFAFGSMAAMIHAVQEASWPSDDPGIGSIQTVRRSADRTELRRWIVGVGVVTMLLGIAVFGLIFGRL